MRVPAELNLPRATTSTITIANRWDHLLARLGFRRGDHRIDPGIYAVGNPTTKSPVFVTSNYSLSFDALRSALTGIDGYILVLDTKGINVWCAAGKGTFCAHELVTRMEAVGLHGLVEHRLVTLPQLSAPGVAAHEVERRSGFSVEYGPVRAADLPEYLRTRTANAEMRTVRFNLRDRVTLIPVELTFALLPMLVAAGVLYLLQGPLAALAAIAAVLTGVVLFPILLPLIPTRDFSSRGFILGGLIAIPFAATSLLGEPGAVWWRQVGGALAYLLVMPPVTAFTALNFTGSTTFTSWSQVKREMFAYIPRMAWSFGAGALLLASLFLVQRVGGA